MAANKLPAELVLMLLKAAARVPESVLPLVSLNSVSRTFRALFISNSHHFLWKRLVRRTGNAERAKWGIAFAALCAALFDKTLQGMSH